MTNSPPSPPPEKPEPFYLAVLQRELALGTIGLADRVLVTCGGNLDRIKLLAAGFKEVVISNLASHGGHGDYSPFPWEHQDIENLTFADGSFDIVIVHNGLHHCYNPVHAMGELCRVARKIVIAFEPYETWLTRLGARLGYGQRYEDSAVHGNGGTGGGVANTEIPNYVYRFRESEVRKFARAFRPYAESPIRFDRTLRANFGRFRALKNPFFRYSFSLVIPIIQTLARFVPSLNNCLSFVIQNPAPEHFHSWIREEQGMPRVNKDYLVAKYGEIPLKSG